MCGIVVAAAKQLIKDLQGRFPSQAVMDALGIVYPQYWRDSHAAEKGFCKHLDMDKAHYGQRRCIGSDEKKNLVLPVLNCYNLKLQELLFKLLMASNSLAMLEPPFDIDLVSHLWRMLDADVQLDVMLTLL